MAVPTVPLVTITPPSLEPSGARTIPEDAWVVAAWSPFPGTVYYQYVTRDGRGWRWRDTPRATQNQVLIELTDEAVTRLEEITEQLKDQAELVESVGTIGATVLIQDETPLTLTCGSRNCPSAIRELFWVMASGFPPEYESLPFAEEDQIYGLSTPILAVFSWLDDFAQPFQLLYIKEDNRLETYLYVEQERSIAKMVAYENWHIRDSEMSQIKACLDTLSQLPDTNNGVDSEVIKISYLLSSQDSLIRLSKADPPICLKDIMTLMQSTLQRENPQTNLNILPFD